MPCPVDVLDVQKPLATEHYHSWLRAYLDKYGVTHIVLDSFPWGIVGEWSHVGRSISRSLICRDLKWQEYQGQISGDMGLFPKRSLIIEPLLSDYESTVCEHGKVTYLNGPIHIKRAKRLTIQNQAQPKILIVHSGSLNEQQHLCRYAIDRIPSLAGNGDAVDQCFCREGIYPAEERFENYDYIVSGAGYNMIANAWSFEGRSRYILYPFERRYDDQRFRLEQYKHGLWQRQRVAANQKAAEWVVNKEV